MEFQKYNVKVKKKKKKTRKRKRKKKNKVTKIIKNIYMKFALKKLGSFFFFQSNIRLKNSKLKG